MKNTSELFVFLLMSVIYIIWLYCHEEYSTIRNSNETVLWEDNHLSDDPIIFSSPSCLDEDGKPIKRLCSNGTWIPEIPPICDRISTNVLCPDEFYEYNGLCIIGYEKYLTRNSVSKSNNLFSSLNNKNITICNENAEVRRNSEAVNCCYMVNSGKWERGMHCNATRYAILPYDLRFHLCPKDCIQSELGNEKCFCKVVDDSNNKLAGVETLIRRDMLAKLVGNDICRVKDDIKPTESKFNTVITHNFYGYTNNNTNCSIIEVGALEKSQNPKPKLVMNFDQKKRKLTLMIENPDGLSPSKKYPLICLTNAGFDPLRTADIHRNRMKRESKHFEIYDVKLEKYIGEYWCEAYALNLMKLKSNVVLAYKERGGNEFALRLRIRRVKDHFDTDHGKIRRDSFQKKLSSYIHELIDAEVRFMRIFRFEPQIADVSLHLTFKKPRDISYEYRDVEKKLLKLPDYVDVLDLSPVEFCLPETTDTRETSSELHWDLTRIWERRIPRQLCYQDNGIPVSRICEGNFIIGASWSDPTGKCSDRIQVPDLTKYLHESLYTNISNDLVDNFTSITYDHPLSYLDIYFYSELIKKVNLENDENLDSINNIFSIINNLSKENKSSLSSSQILFNATDTLLLLLDDQSSNKHTKDESFIFSADNILIRSVYPFKTNVSGIYLIGNSNSSLNELKLSYLYRNETIHDIKLGFQEEVDLAVSVPEEVIKSIEEDAVNVEDIQIIFTIFYEDSLFLSNQHKAASKVVSVTIPGYGSYLEEPIPILMRSSVNGEGSCGFWDLGQGLQRKRGEWSSFGGSYAGNFLNNSDLHICNFSHLTHFALLIVSEPIRVEEGFEEVTDFLIDNDETYYYLNIITIIGGVLSVIGILGIYLTAIIFSQWREKDGTKILLNLSTAILLEIIFLQFSGATNIGSESQCKLVGCLLHYTLLSKFCWMLIYALLQYRRFVKVFGVAPKHLILKSMFFGWGFAIVPVALTLLFSPDGYSKSTICYVHGLPLYTAVIFPVSIVMISNLVVFFIVMYNVTTKKVESTVETKFSILQLYLAVLLFSVLGIPWLFAILAEFVKESTFKKVLLYFFCITGTLQGFILFIFYVVINAETRERWRKYLWKRY
ncbi:adhesion G-protein coupled receptor G6-like isoform X2 [Coccinella septempunctata]|uniref:adhesion G-protein coupled receptor G6-like isoform X2 n=1 Tax=Coccinella septempunctata TaxID=41139 RepID=UPI001D0817EB|nr:adhesion G-protein coupled receptor G6-like isoform X2 [Coccinella septempunctata]